MNKPPPPPPKIEPKPPTVVRYGSPVCELALVIALVVFVVAQIALAVGR